MRQRTLGILAVALMAVGLGLGIGTAIAANQSGSDRLPATDRPENQDGLGHDVRDQGPGGQMWIHNPGRMMPQYPRQVVPQYPGQTLPQNPGQIQTGPPNPGGGSAPSPPA